MNEPVRACPLGCPEPGTALGVLPKTSELNLTREQWTLACCGCGQLLYLSPAPSDADLLAMYVSYGQFGDEYTNEERVRIILTYIGGCFDRLTEAFRWTKPVRVLEVGAGLAWMCRVAKARNASNITISEDVSPEAVAICPWVDHYVQAKVGDGALDRHAPYHLISLTHVIEHLVDPLEVLRRCRSLLAPNGVIFITAPHRPRGWRKGDMEAWRRYSYNHVPAHIQYFSEGSMKRLAAAIGCEVTYWSHHHEEGEAFEAWLAPAKLRQSWWRSLMALRTLGRVRRNLHSY